MAEQRAPLRGVLHFYSETGTEGGYWAFQDQRHIKANTTCFSCATCSAYWDKSQRPNGPYADELPEGKNWHGDRYCAPGTHDFQLVSPESWSYEGLHVLKDGDSLTIYAKDDPSRVVWSGTIKLRQHDLFSQHASGLWTHADQEGIDREQWSEWFFKELPATLLPAPDPTP